MFGLLGARMVFAVKYRNFLPPGYAWRTVLTNLAFVGVFFVIGLVFPVSDNAAHLGGLAGGAILAVIVPAAALDRRPFWSRMTLVVLPCGALALFFAASLAQAAQNLARLDTTTRVTDIQLVEYRARLRFAVNIPRTGAASRGRRLGVVSRGPNALCGPCAAQGRVRSRAEVAGQSTLQKSEGVSEFRRSSANISRSRVWPRARGNQYKFGPGERPGRYLLASKDRLISCLLVPVNKEFP